jgi:glycosyltransferase involved in cell wall biosynthesis
VLILPGTGPLLDRATDAGVEVVVIPNPEESMASAGFQRKIRLVAMRASYVLRLARLFRRERFDLVFVNTTATIFAGVAARLARKPVIWAVHELIENPSRSLLRKMRFIERASNALLYASHSGMRQFPAPRVRRHLVVPNHIDIPTLTSASMTPDAERSLGIAPGDTLIASNGVFPRKAPDVFLEAAGIVAARFPAQLRFVLIGAPADEHKAFYGHLAEIARRDGIADRVTFAGLRNDVPAILARADIFVSPSRNEAAPIILTEAMAAGTPVVATDVGDSRLMLRDGELGSVVPPCNPAALADAILEMLSDIDAARARARHAQQETISTYGSPDFWKPLENLLAEVAGK